MYTSRANIPELWSFLAHLHERTTASRFIDCNVNYTNLYRVFHEDLHVDSTRDNP